MRSNDAATTSASPTSQMSASTFVPWRCNCSLAAAFFTSFVPQMQTSAPAWASPSANPSPMPELPPVTSPTVPLRSKAS